MSCYLTRAGGPFPFHRRIVRVIMQSTVLKGRSNPRTWDNKWANQPHGFQPISPTALQSPWQPDRKYGKPGAPNWVVGSIRLPLAKHRIR